MSVLPVRFLGSDLFFALLLLLCSTPVWAQYTVISAGTDGRKSIALCVDQIYNFDFKGAEITCNKLNAQFPEHPVVSLLCATSKYWQWFPARSNKQLEGSIRKALSEASLKSALWMKGSKGDIGEAMFVYFSAEALLARMDNFEHATMASVGHAKNVYPYIKKSFVYQKTFPDFLLVAGLYNYYREEYVIIRPFYKTIVWFMQDGDKQQGLVQIKEACRQSLFSKPEAGIYLAHILNDYEKNPAGALAGLLILGEQYPSNLFIQGKLAELFLHVGKPAGALVYIHNLLASEILEYKNIGLINKARYELLTGNLTQAAAEASHIISLKPNDELMLAYAHQIMAQVNEKQGNISKCKMHYKRMLDLTEYPILTDPAQAYLQNH